MRFQIKVPDSDLTDVVHEITTNVVAQVVSLAKGEMHDLHLYAPVFQVIKEKLRRCVRGFHVCGCRPHCDLEAQLTELASKVSPPVTLTTLNFRSPRIRRYVLSLDVPIKKFAKGLEVDILRTIVRNVPIKNWKGRLFPALRDAVESILGKYIYFSPSCNRGEYLCEIGECTEFDPWERVKPKEQTPL